MNNFIKFFFASCLGTVVGLFALTLISIGGLAGISMLTGGGKPSVKGNSVLLLDFAQAIPELTDNTSGGASGLPVSFGEKTNGLRDILQAIAAAKTDDKIKGIYMEMDGAAAMGMATRSVLRNALLDFKKSGKFTVAYANRYTQGGYYLASAADKLYINPKGAIQWSGIAAQVPFFKVLFDKLGVKAQVYYAGKFKSATESFRRTEMSPENKLQVREYMQDNYNSMLQSVADSRKMTPEELFKIADGYLVRTANDAVKYKMADGVKYKDEILADLRRRLGLEKKDKIPTVSLDTYIEAHTADNGSGSNRIAVVYAEGNIEDGKSEGGSIGGDTYSALIRKLREDDKVKAIVLRVNSGGGSSLASELIWRELKLCREQGKPVVVSMGDVAASGGYYIAAPANKILAEPTTITGSIGVFGIIPNAGGLMRDKLGITFDTVKIGKYSVASSGNIYYEFNEDEGQIIQQMVDTTYSDFLNRVAEGRKMTKEAVNEIAQGRVWTGKKALTLGLVDTLGGLPDAIRSAAEFAKLKTYKLVHYPESKSAIERLTDKIKGADGSNSARAYMQQQLGKGLYQQYIWLQEVQKMQGVQMRLPFLMENW